MNKERLLMLADALDKDAGLARGIKFDLGVWLSRDRPGRYGHSCGTTGCAIGLALVLPAFNKLGFVPEREETTTSDIHTTRPKYVDPSTGRISANWQAVERFFDLTNQDAEWLFTAEAYKDEPTEGATAELAVAKRIRGYVSHGGVYSE